MVSFLSTCSADRKHCSLTIIITKVHRIITCSLIVASNEMYRETSSVASAKSMSPAEIIVSVRETFPAARIASAPEVVPLQTRPIVGSVRVESLSKLTCT